MNYSGGSGDDTIVGGATDDKLSGGAGSDTLSGGAGSDQLDGGAGNDVLDGGTGADRIIGGGGDDVGVWRYSDWLKNPFGVDYYDGGGNADTLRLYFASNDWANPAIRADMLRFLQFMDANAGPQSDGHLFSFQSFGLQVRNWEKLEIYIDGAKLADPRAPFARDDAITTNENGLMKLGATQGVLCNDFDLDSPNLYVTHVNGQAIGQAPISLPSGATVKILGDGSYEYDPCSAYDQLAEGQSVTDSFVYTVSDGTRTDTATVTLTITGTNDAPVVSDVSAAADEDGAAVTGSYDGDDVDSDDDGTTLTYALTSQPTEGSVTDNGDGTFRFDPGADFQDLAAGESREVSFTYAATDGHGALSNTGTVRVTVTGTNDAPVVSDVSAAADEDGAAVTGSYDGDDVDSDDDGTTLTYALTSQPTEGSVTDNGDGTFRFDPGADFQDLAAGESREVSFTYAATDGHGALSNTGTVRVTVTGTNDAPVVSDVSAAADEDGAAVTGSYDGDDVDSDDDGTTLTYALTSQPTEGSVTDNGDGTFRFDPGADFQDLAAGESREVSFTYAATDGHGALSNTGTVRVTVTGTNDAPVNTAPISKTLAANTSASISGVSVDDVDSDTVTTTVSALNGKVTVGTGDGATISNNNTSSVTISGTLAQVNAALAALVYAGNAGYSGSDTLTIVTSDGSASDTDTVAITITAPPRVAATDIQLTPVLPAGSVNFNQFAFTGTLTATDADAGGFTFSIVSQSTPGLFSISGNTLSSANLSQSTTYTIEVRVTQAGDPSGMGYNETFTVITGGNGNQVDSVNGATGDDVIYGNGGADIIFGLDGNDVLFGQDGGDQLFGGVGNDTLYGQAGDDVLDGGAGQNILTGGAGADTFAFQNRADTSNHVTDLEAGTSATTVDKLRFDVGTAANEFSVGNNNTTVNNFRSGGNATINAAGTEVAVKTDASVSNATVQSTIDSYGNISTGAFFVFHNSDLGHAAIYYDANPSVAGGAVLVAELDNVTLPALQNLNAADFVFV